MDFISYMITNMQYHNLIVYMLRELGWLLTDLFVTICDKLQELFTSVFKLITFFYSDKVLGYIQDNFMPLLFVLLAVSIAMLGYNLITKSDDSERKGIVGAFSQNFILFLVIMFIIPVLLTAKSPLSGSTYNLKSSAMPYEVISSQIDDKYYVRDPYTWTYTLSDEGKEKKKQQEDDAGGVLNILKNLAIDTFTYNNGNADADSTEISVAQKIVKKNIIDWLWVYNQIDDNGKYEGFYLNTKDAGTAIQSADRKHYKMSDVTEIDATEIIVPDENDTDENYGTSFKERSWEDVCGEGCLQESNEIYYANNNQPAYIKVISGSYIDGKPINYHDCSDIGYTFCTSSNNFTEYLFGFKHSVRENSTGLVFDEKACNGVFGIDFLGSYPYRYRISWLPMLIELIATTLVYFFVTFKVATLIWELAVNHILLYIFAAGDMTSGRKTREILKSMLSIVATIIFAYIDLQVFLMACDYLDTTGITGLSNSLIKIFFAYACIDGPQILERVFGIDAGLRRPAAVLAGAAAIGTKAAKTATRAAGGAIGSMKKGAVGLGGYFAGRHAAHQDMNGLFDNDSNDESGRHSNSNDPSSTNRSNESNSLHNGDQNTSPNTTFEDEAVNTNPNQENDNLDDAFSPSKEELSKIAEMAGLTGEIIDLSDNTASAFKNWATNGVDNTMSDNSSEIGESKDEQDVYKNSIKEQCQNDLGMSDEDAEKVANAMTNEMYGTDADSDNSDEISAVKDMVGKYLDYDTATADPSEGGLGMTAAEAMAMKDNSADLGTEYMSHMSDKATEAANKASFNSVGSRNATASARQVETNTRADALGNTGNTTNVSNTNVSGNTEVNKPDNSYIASSSYVKHGAGKSSIFMPNTSKTYRQGKAVGYASAMRKHQKEQLKQQKKEQKKKNKEK